MPTINFAKLPLEDSPQTVIIPSKEANYILQCMNDAHIFYHAYELEPETPEEANEIVSTLEHYRQFNILALTGIQVVSSLSQKTFDYIFSKLPYDDYYIDYCLSLEDDTRPSAREELCRKLQQPLDPGVIAVFESIADAYRNGENLVEMTSTPDTYFPILRGDDDED